MSLSYYQNYYSEIADASDRITIKVVEKSFSISIEEGEKDFFITLSNNTGYDADVSSWILSSNAGNFTLPRHTAIGPKKKMIISSQTANFSVEDKKTLKLITPQGEIVFDYGASVVPKISAKTAAKNTTPTLAPITKLSLPSERSLALPAENLEVTLANNLGAQV